MSNQNSRMKCIEVTERELDGVVERAEYAQRLLSETSQEAWQMSQKDGDARSGIAKLLRQQAQDLRKYLDEHSHELRYGKALA